MVRSIVLLMVMVLMAACNLVNEDALASEDIAGGTEEPTIAVSFVRENGNATPTLAISVQGGPTQLPLPNVFDPLGQTTPLPVGTPLPAGLCEVYTTYSGRDPNNKLSLRAEPSADATLVLKVPNFATVYRVANSQEIEAETYHWLNVVYLESSQRYEGWIARDSFMRDGERDLATATLRPTNQPMPCP